MQVIAPSELVTVMNYMEISHDLSVNVDYDSKDGCDAIFLNVTDSYGIKLFHNPKVAKQSYHYSRIFATLGLTPKVWDLGSVTISGKEIWYYFTETAEEYCGPDLVNDSWDSDDYDSDDDESSSPYNEVAEHDEMMFEMTGFNNDDPHSGNYGYISGHLVCIDVGHIVYRDYASGVVVRPKWS